MDSSVRQPNDKLRYLSATDVYLDLDGSGTLTAADLKVENDVFVIANHSGKSNPAQGAPSVLPAIQHGDPAGPGKGVDG